jgi:hypothetical protein
MRWDRVRTQKQRERSRLDEPTFGMGPVVLALYTGRCRGCRGRINVGDPVVKVDGHWQHVVDRFK